MITLTKKQTSYNVVNLINLIYIKGKVTIDNSKKIISFIGDFNDESDNNLGSFNYYFDEHDNIHIDILIEDQANQEQFKEYVDLTINNLKNEFLKE